MHILDLYATYRIPPQLQRHMLDTAAVGEYIIDHWRWGKTKATFNASTVIKVLLLHDLGNIVKFTTPFIGEMAEQAQYWLGVQAEIAQKYGPFAHQATLAMVQEVATQHPELDLTTTLVVLESIGFYAVENVGYPSWESRIADYADMCVAPQGIVGFAVRMSELIKRYGLTGQEPGIALRKDNAQLIERHATLKLGNLKKAKLSAKYETL